MVQALSVRALQLLSNLILTRLLFPEAFGLMALVTVFVGGLSMISDVGIRPALIRSPRADTPEFQSTAWTLQILRGLVLTALAWGLAWPYAALYDADVLWALAATTAVTTTIAGAASIEVMLHERKLTLARVALMHIGAKLFGIIATILFAWASGSVWALAWGALFGAAAKTLLSHILFPSPNHRLGWNRDVLAEILVFGRWVMLGTLLTYFGGQGLRAIEGVLVDLETLAFLAIASQFGLMLGEIANAVLRGVLFPALAEVHRTRPAALPGLAVRTHRGLLAISLPVFFAMSLGGEILIDFFYDDRYAQAGVFLTFLALNGALVVIPMTFARALLVLGDSRTYAGVTGITAALQIAGTVAGFFVGGMTGMILGFGLATTMGSIAVFWAARRYGIGDPLVVAVATLAVYIFYGLTLTGSL